jgi:hypothetical protein
MSRKKEMYFLQHKYPWQNEWTDVINSEVLDDLCFLEILKDEPYHLIEIEYRIIQKEIVQLRNKDKKVIRPIPMFSNKGLVEHVKTLKEMPEDA